MLVIALVPMLRPDQTKPVSADAIVSSGDFAIAQLYPPSPETSGKGKASRLAGEVVSMVSPGEVKRWKKDGEW